MNSLGLIIGFRRGIFLNHPTDLNWLISLQRHRSDECTSVDAGTTDKTFLVWVYNVSQEQPYTVFRALVNSTAQDIIAQVSQLSTQIVVQNLTWEKLFFLGRVDTNL